MMARKTRRPEGLTPRQLEVLQFVAEFTERHGYSPTMQELADRFEVSKVTVFEHLDALERKGWLRRSKYKARSLQIEPDVELPEVEAPEAGIPIAGHIAAGLPIEAVADDQTLDVDSMFTSRYGTYVLRVRGDSMIDEHIADGDYVIVERKADPHDGQTVVALVDGEEATLKKFYREGRQIRLQPANEAYEPIFVDADKVNIQGVVIGVLRKFGD